LLYSDGKLPIDLDAGEPLIGGAPTCCLDNSMAYDRWAPTTDRSCQLMTRFGGQLVKRKAKVGRFKALGSLRL